MKITDLKCAVIGKNPIVRIVTDEGISGYGEVEQYKPYLKPFVLYLREALLGEDPTNVERVMLKIRQRGAFKPWGRAVSAIEMALWDVAGQGGGRCRSTSCSAARSATSVRVYNGGAAQAADGPDPEGLRRRDAADEGAAARASPSSSRASPSTAR